MEKVQIGKKVVVSRSKPTLIAEIGINHGGSLETAKAMARMAVEHGADIIKHQTHVVSEHHVHFVFLDDLLRVES